MGAIPSGKGGEGFPPLFPPQNAGFGGIWGAAAETGWSSGRGGGGKEREGGGEGAAAGPEYWPCRASPHGATRLSRQHMWRDRLSHVSAPVAQRWLGPPAGPPCRATCNGATEANCRAGASGATKRATACK